MSFLILRLNSSWDEFIYMTMVLILIPFFHVYVNNMQRNGIWRDYRGALCFPDNNIVLSFFFRRMN